MSRRWAWPSVLGVLALLYWGARVPVDLQRSVAVALEAGDVQEVCRRAGYSPDDFWERAKAMGVSAAVVRPEPLSKLAERGEVLRFTAEEIEKWKAVGLVSPGVALKPDSLWIRDRQTAAQLLESAQRGGLSASTSAAGGYAVLQFAGPVDPGLEVYDAGLLAALSARGVAAVRPGLDSPGVKLRAWDVRSGLAPLLRAAYSRPNRMIVARLSPDRGVEGNLEPLRAGLRELLERGVDLEAPLPKAGSPAGRKRAALFLAWLLGLLGPLLAARAGLLALKRGRSEALSRWPVVSPEFQLALGMVTQAAAAALAGLAVRGLGVYPALGTAGPWTALTFAGPVLVGAATLYAIDPARWLARFKSPVTWAQAAAGLCLVTAAALFLEPRAALARLSLLPVTPRWGLGSAAFWWWPWRWREILIGYPCLLQSLYLVNWRMDCPDCEGMKKDILNDPRGWFLLGLLGPSGAVVAFGGGAPAGMVLGQTAMALLAGSALGAAGLGARAAASALGSKGPEAARSVDPADRVC